MKAGGYPDGARTTPVPDLFFSRDIAQIGDPVALKVALVVLWRIHRRPAGAPPAVAEPAILADPALGRPPGVPEPDAVRALTAAVDALVARGTLLEARLPSEDGPVRWLFVNGREGRRALARMHAGGLALPEPAVFGRAAAHARPTVYALYEENIGLLTPLLTEELRDAEATYPDGWIEDAVRTAVEHNARRWSYVRAVLERWAREGRGDATDRKGDRTGRERDSDGPYAPFIRH